jgi:hypothetical protein
MCTGPSETRDDHEPTLMVIDRRNFTNTVPRRMLCH